ncbi:MAG: DUF3857 domain-containing transglutaminase family protein [Candidatus Krumholzibacteriota bacterium]|nr:DUF3857 domain-containing transglutaminase family protein [Candidatus Krumholzibacteriota bacterium]
MSAERVKRKNCLIAVLFTVIIAAQPAGSFADEAGLPPGDSAAPDVFSRIAAAGVAADHGNAAYLIVYDHTINNMKPSGVTYADSYIIQKVLTPAGQRSQSVLRWNYDPQSSYVELREVNIIRDGKKIPVDLSNAHDLPAPQYAIYWNDRIKTLQLPRLNINDGIEIKLFRKGFTYALLGDKGSGTGEAPDDDRYIPPMPGEYFDIVLFADDAPIVEKKYTLIIPPEKRLHSEIYNGPLYSSTSFTSENNEYSWWGLDLPAAVREPRQPDRSDFVPKVVMATAESWEAKSRWFFDVNRNQFDVTEDIQAKVDEIFSEAGVENGSEEKKARVLLHWVAQNIRYSGQTMGEGEGFTLHPGAMIFEQRHGVCKDIAGMLVTMMRAANMNSFAAMTMAGSRIDDLPADQFNHCVCALKKADGSFTMYDPTWVPYNNNIWSLLEAEQHYLVGTPEGEPLSRIAYSPPEESPLRIVNDAKLLKDGTLEGELRFSGSGAMDSRLRGIVNYSRKCDLETAAARLLSNISSRVEILNLKYHPIDDFSADMWMTVKYRIASFALPVADGLEFRSPVMQVVFNNVRLFRPSRTEWGDKRETDVFLYYTELFEGTENIQLPKGYSVADPPSSDLVDETYAGFRGTSRMEKGTLIITQRAEIKRRQIPPDGYGGFKKTLDEAKEWGEILFRAEKGGK